jgi:hypothetical protein
MLTKYPVNVGLYDWGLKMGYFNPKEMIRNHQILFRVFLVLPWSITITKSVNKISTLIQYVASLPWALMPPFRKSPPLKDQ